MLQCLMYLEGKIWEIRSVLSMRSDVLLAFIFGSFTEGRLTKESDVDIAILFDNNPDFSTITEIDDELSSITGLKTDIVVLNYASPIIKMQVLKKGQLLKKANDSIYNDFFVQTVKQYDDIKRVRRPQEENILRGRLYVRT